MFGTTFKVWAMILLVLARVLVGPSAHAHDTQVSSDVQASAEQASAEQAQVPCPEHSEGEHVPPPAASERFAQSTDQRSADHGMDCCEAGGCECVCASGVAFLGSLSVISLILIDERRLSALALPRASHRLAALFRPPA